MDENIEFPRPQLPEGWIWLDEVERKSVVFLDRPLIQADAFHLLAGPKNVGKGTWLADVAARVTRGEFGPKQRVVWIVAGEDSLGMDVLPRIEAAEGDVSKVATLKMRLSLPDDVPQIRRVTEDLHAGLVIVDPISGMFKGSPTDDVAVRHAISPLNDLAHDLEVVVFGVRHLGKSRDPAAIDRVLGSVEWVNVPRVVLAMAFDGEHHKHIQVIAGNRVRRGSSGRSIHTVEVQLPGLDEPVPRAVNNGESAKDIEDLLQQRPDSASASKTTKAKILMLKLLEEGHQDDQEAFNAKVAQEAELSVPTVKNAKTALKDEGLLKFIALEKNEKDKVTLWRIARTTAPVPDKYRTDSGRGTGQGDGTGGVLGGCPDSSIESKDSKGLTSRPPDVTDCKDKSQSPLTEDFGF